MTLKAQKLLRVNPAKTKNYLIPKKPFSPPVIPVITTSLTFHFFFDRFFTNWSVDKSG